MIEEYFRLMGAYRRPFIDVDVSLPDASSLPIRIAFEVDTGADRTLLSPWDGQRLYDSFGLDIRTMPQGNPIGGIGGIVQTRTVRATLVLGSYQTTMPLHVVDIPPGPSAMPSLIGTRHHLRLRSLHGTRRRQAASPENRRSNHPTA